MLDSRWNNEYEWHFPEVFSAEQEFLRSDGEVKEVPKALENQVLARIHQRQGLIGQALC